MNKNVLSKSLVRAPQQFLSPKNGLDPARIVKAVKFKLEMYSEHPNYFKPYGSLLFAGSQGSGKTLTSVVYARNVLKTYPCCILCTNLRIKDRPFNAYILHQKKSPDTLKALYEKFLEERREAFFKATIAELEADFYELKYPETTVEEYVKLNLKSIPFTRVIG